MQREKTLSALVLALGVLTPILLLFSLNLGFDYLPGIIWFVLLTIFGFIILGKLPQKKSEKTRIAVGLIIAVISSFFLFMLLYGTYAITEYVPHQCQINPGFICKEYELLDDTHTEGYDMARFILQTTQEKHIWVDDFSYSSTYLDEEKVLCDIPNTGFPYKLVPSEPWEVTCIFANNSVLNSEGKTKMHFTFTFSTGGEAYNEARTVNAYGEIYTGIGPYAKQRYSPANIKMSIVIGFFGLLLYIIAVIWFAMK